MSKVGHQLSRSRDQLSQSRTTHRTRPRPCSKQPTPCPRRRRCRSRCRTARCPARLSAGSPRLPRPLRCVRAFGPGSRGRDSNGHRLRGKAQAELLSQGAGGPRVVFSRTTNESTQRTAGDPAVQLLEAVRAVGPDLRRPAELAARVVKRDQRRLCGAGWPKPDENTAAANKETGDFKKTA